MGMMVWVFRRAGYIQVWKEWRWRYWRKWICTTSCLNFKRSVLSPNRQEPSRAVCHHERLVPALLRTLTTRTCSWPAMRSPEESNSAPWQKDPFVLCSTSWFLERTGQSPRCPVSAGAKLVRRWGTFLVRPWYWWCRRCLNGVLGRREMDGLPQASKTLREKGWENTCAVDAGS